MSKPRVPLRSVVAGRATCKLCGLESDVRLDGTMFTHLVNAVTNCPASNTTATVQRLNLEEVEAEDLDVARILAATRAREEVSGVDLAAEELDRLEQALAAHPDEEDNALVLRLIAEVRRHRALMDRYRGLLREASARIDCDGNHNFDGPGEDLGGR